MHAAAKNAISRTYRELLKKKVNEKTMKGKMNIKIRNPQKIW